MPAALVDQRGELNSGKPHHRGGALGYLWRWWGGDDVFLVVLHRDFTIARLMDWACVLGHGRVCGWSWFSQCLWHPDCGGVIAQANGSAFEVLDADPGADQAIEHVFHWFERRQG